MLQIALIWPWAVEVWDTRESQQRLCFISAGSHEDDLLFEKCCPETGVDSRLGASGNTRPQAPANAARGRIARRCAQKKLRPRRIARLNISIVWQLTQAEEEATGTTESWKDECSANPAPSGGAPDLFE